MAELAEAAERAHGWQDADGFAFDGLWPEHADIVAAFLSADTQWRVAVGDRLFTIGLDYAGARAGIEAAGIPITPSLWSGLRIMEAAALELLNARRP